MARKASAPPRDRRHDQTAASEPTRRGRPGRAGWGCVPPRAARGRVGRAPARDWRRTTSERCTVVNAISAPNEDRPATVAPPSMTIAAIQGVSLRGRTRAREAGRSPSRAMAKSIRLPHDEGDQRRVRRGKQRNRTDGPCQRRRGIHHRGGQRSVTGGEMFRSDQGDTGEADENVEHRGDAQAEEDGPRQITGRMAGLFCQVRDVFKSQIGEEDQRRAGEDSRLRPGEDCRPELGRVTPMPMTSSSPMASTSVKTTFVQLDWRMPMMFSRVTSASKTPGRAAPAAEQGPGDSLRRPGRRCPQWPRLRRR